MILTGIKDEYQDGTANLEHCLRQHCAFCLYNDFDQILQTDKIAVQCCECGKTMYVKYDNIALTMFCDKCKDTQIMPKHIEALQTRLLSIQKRLIDI